MRFIDYVKYNVWDFLLCACASSALCYTCLIAFIATHPLQDKLLLVLGTCVAITLALFVVAFNKRSAIVGSTLLVFALIGAVLACWSASPAESILDDVVGNKVLFVLLAAASTVMVFVLSRRKATTIVLLVGGLVLCSLIEYLYWDGRFASAALFAIAAAVLYASRNYRVKLAGSDAEKLMFGSVAAVSAAITVLSVAIAAGVFVFAIAPLDPPGVIVKLLTRHVQLAEEEVRGVGDTLSVRNDLIFTILADGTVASRSESEGREDNPDESSEDSQSQDEQDQDVAGASFGLDNTGDESASALSMNLPDYWLLLIALVPIMLVAATIAVRKTLRKRRYRRMRGLPPDRQVQRFFRYFLDSFAKMKIPPASHETLNEYVESLGGVLGSFEGTSEPVFGELAQSYSRCAYGGAEPSVEELNMFDAYYRGFHRSARRYVGRLRYLPLFFRI